MQINARVGPSLDIGVFKFEAIVTGEAEYFPFFPCNPVFTHPAQERSEVAAGAALEICVGLGRRLRKCGNVFNGEIFNKVTEK